MTIHIGWVFLGHLFIQLVLAAVIVVGFQLAALIDMDQLAPWWFNGLYFVTLIGGIGFLSYLVWS